MLALCLVLFAPSLPPEKQAEVVAAAEAAKGVHYQLGGRLKAAGDGLDCQGLVFLALQPLTRCGWRSWSVMPTTSIKGELGLPVADASPAANADLETAIARLEAGDVIYWLSSIENPAEASLASINGVKQWVWHMGVYLGDGKAISADPFSMQVSEHDLAAYTREHYEGLFATRMKDGPRAAQCRAHGPMELKR